MSFNQVIRYIGYAAGSTMSAVVLQSSTPRGHLLPVGSGYTVAGLIGCAVWVICIVVSLILPRLPDRRPRPVDHRDAVSSSSASVAS
jgi:hypothetical protein